MSYSAVIKDGKVVDTRASSLSDSTERKTQNTLDKEAFLQLLVAQMQYQDPLEPMSNTEYVSQLATFSELEAMTNLNDTMGIARATELVGKNVIVRTTSEATGETYKTQGVVDYVVVENGSAYLAIGEELYSLDDLDTVISDEYWDDYQNNVKPGEEGVDPVHAKEVVQLISELPEKDEVTEEHQEAVKAAREAYNALSDDEKKLIANDSLYKLIQAEGALAKLLADKEANNTNTGSSAETETEN